MDARIDVDTLLAQSGWLHALARRLARDDASADDLVQDTLVAAMERPPGDQRGFRGWLATVLQNRAREKQRSERMRAHHEPRAARPEAVDETAEQDRALDQVRLQRALAAAILDLPEPYRKAITLRWVDGLSPREVAEAQGITYGAARQRLARGAALLREKLDRDCGGRAAWSALVLLLPREAHPHSVPHVIEVLAVSTQLKFVATAVVIVAVCLWLALGGRSGEPTSSAATTPIRAEPLDVADGPRAQKASTASDTMRASAVDAHTRAPASSDSHDLTGLVTDQGDNPIAGARLVVSRVEGCEYSGLDWSIGEQSQVVARSQAAADGTFAIPLPPGRAYELEVDAPGFARARFANRYAGEHVIVRLLPGATVLVDVVRRADDSPVEGARIRAYARAEGKMNDRRPVFEGTTDASGRARFDGVSAIALLLQLQPKEDATPGWKDVELAPGVVERITFRLDAGPTIRGRVTEHGTNRPIAGATVGEGWFMGRTVTTDADGEYVYANFPLEGVFEMGFKAPGFGHRVLGVRGYEANAPFPERLDVELQHARKVRGRVMDASRSPLHDVYVVAGAYAYAGGGQQSDWCTDRSGSDGAFEIRDVRPDLRHVVVLRKDGFGACVFELPPDEWMNDTIDLGEIVLPAARRLSGRVVDSVGAPVADHLVTLSGWNTDRLRFGSKKLDEMDWYAADRNARTDHLGRFTFADIAPGDYTAKACWPGSRNTVSKAAAVADTDVTGLELVMESGIPIEGRVVGPDGLAVPDVRIHLEADREGERLSDVTLDCGTDGRFRFPHVKAGVYELTARHNGGRGAVALATTTLHGIAAGRRDLVVDMRTVARLAGIVLDREGRPLEGVMVWAFEGTGRLADARASTGKDGTFQMRLPAGMVVDLEVRTPERQREYWDPAARLAPDRRVTGVTAGSERIEIRLD